MGALAVHVLTEAEQETRKAQREEALAKVAQKLRELAQAREQNAFDMGKLLCEVAGGVLRMNLPIHENRRDIALWAKKEVGLSYVRTGQLMDAWKVKVILELNARLNPPMTEYQVRPLTPLLAHENAGKKLIQKIWERAVEEMKNKKNGPTRSEVSKIAKEEAPGIIGAKKKSQSTSKNEALEQIKRLAGKYRHSSFVEAIKEYLKEIQQ